MYLFINSCLFLIIFIVARQRNLEGDFIVVSFFKKKLFLSMVSSERSFVIGEIEING